MWAKGGHAPLLEECMWAKGGHAPLLEECTWASAVLETDGVSDLLSQHNVHLISHPLSHTHSCYPTWLSAANQLTTTLYLLGYLRQPLGDLGGRTIVKPRVPRTGGYGGQPEMLVKPRVPRTGGYGGQPEILVKPRVPYWGIWGQPELYWYIIII